MKAIILEKFKEIFGDTEGVNVFFHRVVSI